MNQERKAPGFGTKAIHAGQRKDRQYGALATPIYQTSTFCFDCAEQGGRRFAGEEEGFLYTRLGNPTTAVLQDRLAALEGGEAALVTSSGIGAITAAIWTLCRAGDHIVADDTLYGCTHAFLAQGISRYGVEVTFVDTGNAAALQRALRPNTRLVYLETPANPNLKIVDLRQVSDIAHGYNREIKVICDNTFSSPYLQQPLRFGCDAVVHSVTKYINGHGDVVAGAVIGNRDFIAEVAMFGVKDMTGAAIGAFESYLVLRGLKTLELRMERHSSSAATVADFLRRQKAVSRVYYPGLAEHPGHAIAQKQMLRFGGMISFELAGGYEGATRMLNRLKLCSLAVSLGDTETLIEHPASMTHSTYAPEELAAVNISASLVRISIGLETPEDIIADLDQALQGA